jgi:hypothetical protein
MNESEITCVNLKRTMMERLCAISEIGASYLVSKRYVQKLHYQQELLHYCELQHQRDQYGKNEKASGIFRNLRP